MVNRGYQKQNPAQATMAEDYYKTAWRFSDGFGMMKFELLTVILRGSIIPI